MIERFKGWLLEGNPLIVALKVCLMLPTFILFAVLINTAMLCLIVLGVIISPLAAFILINYYAYKWVRGKL